MGEGEGQWNAGVDPDRVPSAAAHEVIGPSEVEPFLALKFGVDDALQVREGAVSEIDRHARVVGQSSHKTPSLIGVAGPDPGCRRPHGPGQIGVVMGCGLGR